MHGGFEDVSKVHLAGLEGLDYPRRGESRLAVTPALVWQVVDVVDV